MGKYENGFAIAPSDSTEFANATRAIYVGTAGNLVVVFPSGGAVTFTAVPAGTVLGVVARRVNATGTTATNLVGLF